MHPTTRGREFIEGARKSLHSISILLAQVDRELEVFFQEIEDLEDEMLEGSLDVAE